MIALPTQVVVVGAGQAGAEVAMELHRQGFAGRITLIGDEPHPPYRRPPLSKAYLAGKADAEALWVTSAERLLAMNVELLCGVRVQQIDRSGRAVCLEDGRRLGYDVLVLATGGRARALPVTGADAESVHVLRTIADVDRIRAAATPGRHVLIAGGGFVGLEAAAALCGQGLQVTLVEAAPRVLSRVASPPISTFFERVHREAGVVLKLGCAVASIRAGATLEVALTDGAKVSADLVIAGIGLVPDTGLADAAGLAVDDGIVVDAYGRTSDPLIFCGRGLPVTPNAWLGRSIRLESVQNAMEQGRNVARNVLGLAQAYEMLPWFWSDQYDLKLQMVGVPPSTINACFAGIRSMRAFSIFYLRGGRMIAADVVNRPQEFMVARKLVASGTQVDRERLADEGQALRDLLVA